MSIRLKITLLFAAIVLVILMIVCGSVYYFSYTSRLNNIKTRLTNWAITTGKLLSQSADFNQKLVLKIDASTTLAMKNKTVQAYDYLNNRKYMYSDDSSDSVSFNGLLLDKSRKGNDIYFTAGKREGIAHYFVDKNYGLVIIAAAYDEEGIRKLQQLGFILLFSFAGGILIALAAGYFFSKQLLIPLRKIADEVNKISVQNLEDRIKTHNGKDEWDYLSTTLNQLLNRLQVSFDIHRRFISNASHELLTPLTSISSQLEISLNRDRDVREYQAVIGSVYQDVHRLGKLTQTLLEFARASGDPGGLEIDLVRIDEILLAIPGEITKINELYTVTITFGELPDEDEKLLVFGNEALLFTAIKNLVINACKYSDNHLAEVKLTYQLNVISIQIRDTGKGISDTEKENIFQPFYRVDEKNINQGFGLGLSLASQIIKLHKGQLSLESELNRGSIFSIILPPAGSLL
jgi:two-component system, OmpR family, sensor histidine kinase ArlS